MALCKTLQMFSRSTRTIEEDRFLPKLLPAHLSVYANAAGVHHNAESHRPQLERSIQRSIPSRSLIHSRYGDRVEAVEQHTQIRHLGRVVIVAFGASLHYSLRINSEYAYRTS